MQEIRCPKCGEVFQVDESGYQHIAKQIRDAEFRRELDQRVTELNVQKEKDIDLRMLQIRRENDDTVARKDQEILRLKAEAEGYALELKHQKIELTVTKESEFQRLQKAQEQQHSRILAEKEAALAEKDAEIVRLTEKLKASGMEKQLAVQDALLLQQQTLSEKETQIVSLKSELKSREAENRLSEKNLSDQFAQQLRQKEEQIEYYKDLKIRQSTKMVGENLEQHCEIQFNQLRMAAFPRAYFEKDNDARHGSKGDYIFREADEDGTEFISIMFEMKNEMDETATKHKNEDFFAKLDRDRREKKCEYAVLVSLLERNNEYYNDGIVDVSYRYEKMYVIRPQFFIPLITLLRNAARNSLKYRQELAIVRSQQIDIQNFEANMADFKDKFGRNYRLASEKFQTAIDEIDKTIDHLQKTKAALLSSENNLRLANDKAESLSIKRLTKNAPSVRAMFDAQREEN